MSGAILGLIVAWLIWRGRKSDATTIKVGHALEGAGEALTWLGLGALSLAFVAALLFGAVWVLHTLWRLT